MGGGEKKCIEMSDKNERLSITPNNISGGSNILFVLYLKKKKNELRSVHVWFVFLAFFIYTIVWITEIRAKPTVRLLFYAIVTFLYDIEHNVTLSLYVWKKWKTVDYFGEY